MSITDADAKALTVTYANATNPNVKRVAGQGKDSLHPGYQQQDIPAESGVAFSNVTQQD